MPVKKKPVGLSISTPEEASDESGWRIKDGVLHLSDATQISAVGFEKYRLGPLIGRGTQGEVQLVQHRQTKKIYALKNINLEVGEIRTGRQLATEFAALKFNLSHVVRTYEVFYTTDGYLRFILEFADHGGFGDIIRKRIPSHRLLEPYLNLFAKDMVLGVSQLHKFGLLHRDIKPPNLLLTASGDVKIADFGVSSLLMQSRATTSVGSVAYMSPERVRSEEYGYPSDVWSVGVTLAEVAIGRFPFPAERAFDVCVVVGENRATVDWPSWEGKCDSQGTPYVFSADLKDFVGQCLRQDPSTRPTAAALLEHPFIAKLNTMSPPPSMVDFIVRNDLPAITWGGLVPRSQMQTIATPAVSAASPSSDPLTRPQPLPQAGGEEAKE